MHAIRATLTNLMGLSGALAVIAAHAADYYVSPTGNATWAQCTDINTPCSWQTAMANAVADDVVYFRGGTYDVGTIGPQRDLANMRPANSGTPGHPITFRAYTGEAPVVTGTVINGSTAAYFGCSYNDFITWDGFAATMQIYTNADGSSTETQTWGSWGSDHCTIRNSNFTGVHQPYYNNTSFVRVEGSSHALVENNYFHNLTVEPGVSVNAAAVWVIGSNNHYALIRNNTIENCVGGVYSKSAPGTTDNISVHSNFLHNAAGAGHVGVYFNLVGPANRVYQNVIVGYKTGIHGVSAYSADTFFVYNNTVYSSSAHAGIQAGPGAITSVEVFNNIVANLSPSLRYFDGVVSYSNHNDFYRAAGNVWNRNYATDYTSLPAWTAATGFDANSITSDPLFVNAGGSNPEHYKLQANSPARTGGRGGAHSTVIGAYITGDEVIGYSPSYVPDTLPPAAPANLSVQ